MAHEVQSIREEIRRCDGVTPAILRRINDALAADPNAAELWELRGDALQLSDGDATTLEDAERSYLRALEVDATFASAYESLGYFYFAVMDDVEKSIVFFEKAIEHGAGESARDGLDQAREEVRTARVRPNSA